MIAIVAIYFAFLTRTYYWDGVLFSIYIENAARGAMDVSALAHPNHLLYTVFGFALYRAASALHIHARAITVLQALDVVASAAAAWVIYRFALRLIRSATLALFCPILFAAGATWWKFSTDADAYSLAVLCELLACYFAFEEQPNWLLTGFFHVCGMLMHELVVFTYIPVLAALWIKHRGRLTPVYVLATGTAVSAAYVFCYSLADHRTYPTFFKWATSYSGASFTSSAGQLVTAYLASYTKLFAGGKISFIEQYFSVPLAIGLAVCGGALVSAAMLFRKPRECGQSFKGRNAILLWSWFIPYAIFLAAFDPGSTFHKLFLWPPLILLIGLYANHNEFLRQRAKALVALAVALAGWNFAAYIYPHTHVSSDPILAMAQKINRELPRDAKVYYAAFSPDDWYLEYFGPGRQWVALPNPPAAVLGEKRPLCLETTALNELERGLGVKLEIDPAQRWDLVNAQHDVRVECLK